MSTESRWHRLLAGYADLVKVTLFAAALCLGVVTIPVALTVAYDGVRRLRAEGELAPLVARMRALWRPATAAGLPALAVAVAAAACAVAVPSPFLTSTGLAISLLAAVVLIRAAATVSRDGSRADVLRDLVLHPGASVALLLPWLALTYVLVVVPVAVTVPLWCVAASLPPLLGLLVTERHRLPSPTTQTTTERSVS